MKKKNTIRTFLITALLLLLVLTALCVFKEATERDLLELALNGDWTKVELAINEGGNVNECTSWEQGSVCLIHLAAASGKADDVRRLLDAGADIGAQDRSRRSPLHYAAIADNVQTLEELLMNGADKSVGDVLLMCPIDIAADRGFTDSVRMLATSRAHKDGTKMEAGPWCSALHYASFRGHADVVAVLLDTGAYCDTPMTVLPPELWGRRPARIGGKSVLDSDYVERVTLTPLEIAAELGHTSTMEVLINSDAAISVRDGRAGSPFHWATAGGDVAAMQLLLEAGAEVDTPDYLDTRPIHWAAYAGQEAAVEYLIDRAASLDSQARVNLGVSSEKGDSLVAHGTPLHCAAFMGHVACVEMLLKAGADANIRNKDGLTALDLAKKKRHVNVVKFLDFAAKADVAPE